jgi:ABC-type nitrate/sulfonate/bicarbonate transport system substrate-binding protein
MSVSRRRYLIGLTAAALVGAAGGAQAQTKLTVMVFQGIQNVPLQAAQQQGYFAKRGLDVEIKIAPNSEELRNGLAEGRYQIVHAGIDNAIAMAEVAKKDVAVVIGGDTGLNHLIVQPEITSYADLRGKTVAVDSPNTAFAFVLYKMLELNGVKRGEYEVKPAGASFLRRDAMLKDKTYAASILNPPFTIQAQKAGLRDLGSAVAAIGPYQSTAGFVMRDWAQANADTLVKYLQAYIEGLRWTTAPANKAAAVAMVMERMRLPEDVAAPAFDRYANPAEGFAKDLALNLDGLRNVLKLRAEITGSGAPPAPDKYIDLSYYDRALKGL